MAFRRTDCRRSDLFARASSSPPDINGYGGSYTTAAGQASAEMALTDECPKWTPQDVFSPHRFLSKQPLFLSSKDNLWRIAQALCKRSVVVNEQISFECTYGATSVRGETPEISTMTLEGMISQPGSTIKPDALRNFLRFGVFSDRELRQCYGSCGVGTCRKELW